MPRSMPVEHIHDILIDRGQNLLNHEGKPFAYLTEENKEGICYGLASMMAQAIFCRQVDRFRDRLDWLKKHTSEEVNQWVKKASNLSYAEREFIFEKAKRKEQLSEEEFNILIASEIPAFYEGINVYQNKIYDKTFLTQADKSNLYGYNQELLDLLRPAILDEDPPTYLEKSFSGVYTQENLIDYMSSFEKIAKNSNIKNPICFHLGSLNHETLLSYDPVSKAWQFYDANQDIILGDHATIANHILSGFESEELAIFSTRLSCLSSDQDSLNEIFTKWKPNINEIRGFNKEQNEKINQSGPYNGTWLYIASRNNDLESASYLLSKNININSKTNDRNQTALHAAACNNNLEMFKILLEKKPDLNIQDNKRWTTLHFAASHNNLEMVTLLLKRS